MPWSQSPSSQSSGQHRCHQQGCLHGNTWWLHFKQDQSWIDGVESKERPAEHGSLTKVIQTPSAHMCLCLIWAHFTTMGMGDHLFSLLVILYAKEGSPHGMVVGHQHGLTSGLSVICALCWRAPVEEPWTYAQILPAQGGREGRGWVFWAGMGWGPFKMHQEMESFSSKALKAG